ncbi:hypothetical protein VA596_23690 [Amycolatopsis sp., V23-08]|uniref:Uncharacterized protein n=1 Tax=Amycolatopsis heterodermiae TaxID=3110235 RepID=A0ABU5RA88_9PSEU|nr:hypothetical protein [Amycolatopsis sp., V23-08]MEA5362559.1 hypothetical protein [Amycolatopsis sp., V23-08]
MAVRGWFPREHDVEVPRLRRLSVRAWLRGRLADHRRSRAACDALCEHDEQSPPCWICSVRYW